MPQYRITGGILLVACFILSARPLLGGAQEVAASNSPETSAPRSFPFEYERGLIFVSVTVNGQPARFFLDTGATGNMIDTEFARQHSIPSAPKMITLSGTHSTSKEEKAIVRDLDLRLFGIDVRAKETLVIDFSSFRKYNFPSFDGVLGLPLFARHSVMIDYAHRLLTIDDETPPGNGDTVLPIKPTPFAIVSAKIGTPDGKLHAGKFLIDTGNDASVAFDTWFADKYPAVFLKRWTDPKERLVEMTGSLHAVDEALLFALHMGGATLGNLQVTISPMTESKPNRHTPAGLIGNALLEKFIVTIDYPHQRLILRQSASEPKEQQVKH